MFVVIQRPIHVDIDVDLEVKDFEDDSDDDAQFFNTFIIEHEVISNGVFTVMVSPYSYDQDSIMCEVPSRFTVDYEALKEIYNDPAKFILDYVVKFDERYKITESGLLSDDMKFEQIDLNSKSLLYKLPYGFKVVKYSIPNKDVIDIIVYNYIEDDYITTEEDITLLDLALGAGNYRLMSKPDAEKCIEDNDKRIGLLKEELEKPLPILTDPDKAKSLIAQIFKK